MMSNSATLNSEADRWRYQIDRFVRDNLQDVAALSWGLHLQWTEDGEEGKFLGIDMQPQPHFIVCDRPALETLNRNADNLLRELMGVADHHDPQKEVLIIGIGNGQVKAIQFAADPLPPECFESAGADTNALLDRLEPRLATIADRRDPPPPQVPVFPKRLNDDDLIV